MPEKRKLFALMTALSSCILLLAATYAWTNLNSSIINSWSGAGKTEPGKTPGGTLHDDYIEGGANKDVYVENWGEEPLFVRIKLTEYMEMGEGAGIKENDPGENRAVPLDNSANSSINNLATWLPHGSNHSTDPAGPIGDIFHDYWKWTMGGQKYYYPAPPDKRGKQDSAGNEYVDSSSTGLIGPSNAGARQTLNAQVLTMGDWISKGEPLGNYWVLDTDGYAYWASPLMPGEATGLLLRKVELVKQPAADYYYAIHINAQMATESGAPDNYPMFFNDATPQGESLVYKIASALTSEGMPTGTPPLPTVIPQNTPAATNTPTANTAQPLSVTPKPTSSQPDTVTPTQQTPSTPTAAPSGTATPTTSPQPTSLPTVSHPLIGSWGTSSHITDFLYNQATLSTYGGGSTERGIYFREDGTYRYLIITTGYGPGTLAGWLVDNGEFTISGDQVILYNTLRSWTNTKDFSKSYTDEPTSDQTRTFEIIYDQDTGKPKLRLQNTTIYNDGTVGFDVYIRLD